MLRLFNSIDRASDSFITEENDIAREALEGLITRLESDIIDGSWMTKGYMDIDFKMMPALVKQANNKYPEMNLKLAMTFEDLCVSVQKTIDDGIQSSRFITNILNRSMPHFVVIDLKTIDDKTSLVLFEATKLDHKISKILISRMKRVIEASQLPSCYYSIVEMDIQRSFSECGIFSLALAKKLYHEAEKLERIHKDNIDGVLCDCESYLPYDKLDTYLPVTFYKHAQGISRINEYVKSNPEAANKIINKKNETIFERFDRNSIVVNKKNVSVSSHRKRISEYRSLIR
ncbi:Effector protein yopJ (Virulence factor yopJ) [Bartonella clarridgeiae 73]|uniref:Effector protein yopJ (Virulence factor yopJ) n=1 Tax=Bartonella clarridgeiae (strain CCUG 45776 / CIP 104772 / 73) TaxID=696125 RepID=E6YIF4_BARC7|nr:YopJ/AvrA family T3SS effector serine/threonine acetyltransferase [Bartonella clarridgeiae]WCR54788.1 MAG: Type III secretion injected virulence protein (YopP YopJ induces apoptosis prevents cytokine induction inhibits NFkb activation) [Bartonella clarridgeiae]CBI76642.1 Effector protein yopJ (Virulence factor yopJ) [Bartonella clarridgeiae 73]